MPSGVGADLHHYLREAREGVLRAVQGLSEYDLRRPMTPTGTNLLGLVKHLAGVEYGYLGAAVGRPGPTLPWEEDGTVWEGADLWARADETSSWVLGLYREARAHSDESITTLPLDHPARVPWWPAARRHTTFGHLLVRVVAETAQHAGHADIIREGIDGQAGRDRDLVGDDAYWSEYVATVQAAADAHR